MDLYMSEVDLLIKLRQISEFGDLEERQEHLRESIKQHAQFLTFFYRRDAKTRRTALFHKKFFSAP